MDKRIKDSRAQEERVAKVTGGWRVPGSGSGYMRKGDVRSGSWLIECKRTDKDSYRLTTAVIEKIEYEALLDFREWALFLDINHRDLVVMSENAFLTLTHGRL